MSELSASLSKWFSERPKWMQFAATRLLEQEEIAAKDILLFASLCQQEADGTLTHTDCSFPTSAFSLDTSGSLRLCSISNIEGVNALAPKKPLEFGISNITVVYGHNGSGKSGYVRLLKHICGARTPGTLYPNVYDTSPNNQKADITFEKNGTIANHSWTGQGICEELQSIDIFDTSFGRVFVSSEDEVTYEPPVLSFFSALIGICEKVAEALDLEVYRHQSKKPNMSAELKPTTEGLWYERLNATTKLREIEKICSFSSQDEIEIQDLQKRLAEQAPGEKAKQLRKQKSHVDALVQDAQKCMEQLSDENCRIIIAAKKKSILKKTAADAAAQKVFSDSHLEDIGSDVWKELWEAARNYSVATAYKDFDYPYVSEDSRCVLCHQTLSLEAKERLLSFENFVKGEMQKTASDAAGEYEIALKTVENIPDSESLKTKIDASGIQQDEIKSQLAVFFSQLQARKDQLPKFESEETIPTLTPPPQWIDDLNGLSKSQEKHAEEYEADAKNDNRDEIKKKLSSLLAKKWLSEHHSAIQEEVNRLKLLSKIQNARKTTNTKSLSQKKGELAEALITDAFVQRFNSELKALGASQVKVELVKSKVTKGRVLHKLQLRDTSYGTLSDVLSEGENRIVSIAAFLADVTGNISKAPFIFDDPISSLDQTFEEAVVQRICAMSSKRQVIIFTHRLSLLGLIQDYAKKVSIEPQIVCIREESWGTGEPGDTPLFAKRPDKALNSLLNERLPVGRTLLKDHGREVYEPYAKALCSDFRILLERMIECELIADVVQRYRRAINTIGKIDKLAKINEEDCAYFDEFMTKYSRYEHSQPQEAPVTLPDPDEFESDFNTLKTWQKEFKDRPVESQVIQ